MRRARVVASTLAIAAALAVAGCGGGSGSSSSTHYEATVNSFCSSINGAAKQVQKDAADLQTKAAKNPRKAIQALSGALAGFADSTAAAVDKLRHVSVPSTYSDFHGKAVRGFDNVVVKLRQAANAAKSGNLQAITALGMSLSSVKLPDPPKALKDKAPACRDIAR